MQFELMRPYDRHFALRRLAWQSLIYGHCIGKFKLF